MNDADFSPRPDASSLPNPCLARPFSSPNVCFAGPGEFSHPGIHHGIARPFSSPVDPSPADAAEFSFSSPSAPSLSLVPLQIMDASERQGPYPPPSPLGGSGRPSAVRRRVAKHIDDTLAQYLVQLRRMVHSSTGSKSGGERSFDSPERNRPFDSSLKKLRLRSSAAAVSDLLNAIQNAEQDLHPVLHSEAEAMVSDLQEEIAIQKVENRKLQSELQGGGPDAMNGGELLDECRALRSELAIFEQEQMEAQHKLVAERSGKNEAARALAVTESDHRESLAKCEGTQQRLAELEASMDIDETRKNKPIRNMRSEIAQLQKSFKEELATLNHELQMESATQPWHPERTELVASVEKLRDEVRNGREYAEDWYLALVAHDGGEGRAGAPLIVDDNDQEKAASLEDPVFRAARMRNEELKFELQDLYEDIELMQPKLEEIRLEAQAKEQELEPERQRIQDQINKELGDDKWAKKDEFEKEIEGFEASLRKHLETHGARRLQRIYRHHRIRQRFIEEAEVVVSRANILVDEEKDAERRYSELLEQQNDQEHRIAEVQQRIAESHLECQEAVAKLEALPNEAKLAMVLQETSDTIYDFGQNLGARVARIELEQLLAPTRV